MYIPKHFMAVDKLGRAFEYRLKEIRNDGKGFRDIVLKNITVNDGTNTEVEPAWFENRTIQEMVD